VIPFISILPKFSGFFIIIRLLFILEPVGDLFPDILDFLNTFTIVTGGIAGLFEINIFKIIACSSIVNIGIFLFPVLDSDFVGFHISLLFFIIYFILLLNLFSCVFAFRFRHSLLLQNLDDLKVISSTYPLLAFLFVMALFSFIGIPPLAGFFPKFLSVYQIVEGVIF